MPFAFCTRCGAWAARRPRRLRQPCGEPTANGKLALRRIARGWHPWRRRATDGTLQPRTSIKVATRNRKDGAEGPIKRRRQRSEETSGPVDLSAAPPPQRSSRRRKEDADCGVDAIMDDPADGADLLPDDVLQQDGDELFDLFQRTEAADGMADYDSNFDIFGHGGDLDQRQEDADGTLVMNSANGKGRSEDDGMEGEGARTTKWEPRQAGSSTDGLVLRPGAEHGCTGEDTGEMIYEAGVNRMYPFTQNAARAECTSRCVVGARAGPEGPRDASSTAAVAPGFGGDATAAVKAERGAAILDLEDNARGAQAERGKAAIGPPSGCAAPLEGCKGGTVTKRPDNKPPQKWPTRPVAGTGRPNLNPPRRWPQRPVTGAGNLWQVLSE